MQLENKIDKKFQELFHIEGNLYASSGRINLMGEHTDYNGGFVFPGAIDKAIMAEIALNNSNMVTLSAAWQWEKRVRNIQ